MKPNNSIKYAVIIPALNEEKSIEFVITGIPKKFRDTIIVVDNGSSDQTASLAMSLGAIVLKCPQRGYGSACLAGVAYAKKMAADIYIFLDADYSDYPEDMEKIVDQLFEQQADLVIGSRMLGLAESGSLLPQARFGNWLATTIMYYRFGFRFSDLGPFRAIRSSALEKIQMQDTNFGWTIEMQIKALRLNLKVAEVSVRYRQRIGVSKITGTVKGTIFASLKILWVLFRYLSVKN